MRFLKRFLTCPVCKKTGEFYFDRKETFQLCPCCFSFVLVCDSKVIQYKDFEKRIPKHLV